MEFITQDWDKALRALFDGWLVPTLDGKGFETTRFLDPDDPFKTYKDPDQERALRFTLDTKIERLKPLSAMFASAIQGFFDCGADHVHAEVVNLFDGYPLYRLSACYDDVTFITYIDDVEAYSVLPD